MVIPVSIHMMQLNLLVGDMKERELMFLLDRQSKAIDITDYIDELQFRVEVYGFTPMDTWDINNQDYYWVEEYEVWLLDKEPKQLIFTNLWGTQHLGNNAMRTAFMEAGYASKRT